MIRKLFLSAVIAAFCLSFNACEMHPPSQTIDVHSEQLAKEKQAQKGEQPQGGNTNAPQYFPEKKGH